ncbi:DsbA family oxidoreductase [Millisia brevis]|uniref:DsbA family oxidoreductase n=1 Tax=Millisia brevis TaxID=264148 RepID=UPI00082D2333|nr:DsbA family oxidoreductase [Millisia brevis]
MRIDIWSDVVCPWCYIGKRRLESALADFDHADDVEVVWHSFELDPTAPHEPTESVVESLGRKYGGGPEGARQMIARVEALAAQDGLDFDQQDAPHVNTRDAHRVLHLALDELGPQAQGALKERLLATYFSEHGNPADRDTLRAAAVGVGLDAARVDQVLDGDAYTDQVDADIAQARAFGATGVPFYVIDNKYGISGAQSTEVFSDVLGRAWQESHLPVTLVGQGPAEACGPDGC